MRTLPAIPYVVGQWVRGEKFYGRQAQLAEILDGPRDWIWLLGSRRVGKTSLLKQLEHLTAGSEQGFFPLFWDLQGAADPRELHLNFIDALLDAEDRLEEIGLGVAELEEGELFAALARLRRRLRARGLTLLLLCDEVEELLSLRELDPALLRKLRRALQSQEGIRSVLASSIRLWALTEQREDTSPFLHGFVPPLYIHHLTAEEARSLVRQTHLPVELRPAWSDETVETIRRRCDDHPYLLQLVGKRTLELGDLDEACEQVAADPMVSYFFAVDFEMLAATEQRILRFVAAEDQASSDGLRHLSSDSGSVASGLQRLENLGFLRRGPERRFTLPSHFFRRWLRELPSAGLEALAATTETQLEPRPRVEMIDDRYELREEVGRGASGVVFRAWDSVLRTQVALKLLKTDPTTNPDALERVRQEILLARDVGHPNILRIYHLGQDGGQVYLTMQWIEGRTLARVIAEEAPLPPPTAVRLAAKLASALATAHRRQILHRDVKPGNVLVDAQGEPYLADFGLVRLIGEPGITGEGCFIGTPNYASPEQAELGSLDGRSDLYSLGLVLYEMLTGRRPFAGKTSYVVLEMHLLQPPPDPREIVPDLPAPLAEVVLRCLEKDPDRRYPDGEALAAALQGCQK